LLHYTETLLGAKEAAFHLTAAVESSKNLGTGLNETVSCTQFVELATGRNQNKTKC
jgi:hypothetical protein